jgi:hypothetical protein
MQGFPLFAGSSMPNMRAPMMGPPPLMMGSTMATGPYHLPKAKVESLQIWLLSNFELLQSEDVRTTYRPYSNHRLGSHSMQCELVQSLIREPFPEAKHAKLRAAASGRTNNNRYPGTVSTFQTLPLSGLLELLEAMETAK